MQHIDPYSDDFLKKAAENYPLKTDAADWENVAKKLNTLAEKNEIVNGRNYQSVGKRSVLIGALLLIPFAITVTKYFNVGSVPKANALIKNKQVELSTINSVKDLDEGKSKDVVYSAKQIENSVLDKNSVDESQKFFAQLSLENKSLQDDALNNLIRPVNFKSKTSSLFLKQDNKNSVTENINDLGKEEKNLTVTEKKYKGFYIGGAIAPELTSVKFQPTRKSFDIGLLVGYNINKNLGLELGFMLAQKYYYTSGQYIVPNSIGPNDSKILAVNAFNSITEIPLTVQYNLRNENNSRWFASAGAVSYIIHKENYSYVYTKDGEEKQGRTLHNKASQNWFSNVQMSVGYERSFNKICNIRVEPYCRVPLRGIGISDVPVSSVGLNLALIKTIK